MKSFNLIRSLVAAFACVLAQFAHAHAHPKRQMPAADDTVAGSPHQVSIEFDSALEPAFSSIAVADARGKSVISGKSAVDPGNKKLLTVTVADLPPGKYTVTWVAVADDGHRTQGHYRFAVK